jgi:hypothetical protein
MERLNMADLAPIGVRMQPDLREWVKKQAKQNQRSMNNEIFFILENEKARRATNTTGLNELTTNENLRGNSHE